MQDVAGREPGAQGLGGELAHLLVVPQLQRVRDPLQDLHRSPPARLRPSGGPRPCGARTRGSGSPRRTGSSAGTCGPPGPGHEHARDRLDRRHQARVVEGDPDLLRPQRVEERALAAGRPAAVAGAVAAGRACPPSPVPRASSPVALGQAVGEEIGAGRGHRVEHPAPRRGRPRRRAAGCAREAPRRASPRRGRGPRRAGRPARSRDRPGDREGREHGREALGRRAPRRRPAARRARRRRRTRRRGAGAAAGRARPPRAGPGRRGPRGPRAPPPVREADELPHASTIGSVRHPRARRAAAPILSRRARFVSSGSREGVQAPTSRSTSRARALAEGRLALLAPAAERGALDHGRGEADLLLRGASACGRR